MYLIQRGHAKLGYFWWSSKIGSFFWPSKIGSFFRPIKIGPFWGYVMRVLFCSQRFMRSIKAIRLRKIPFGSRNKKRRAIMGKRRARWIFFSLSWIHSRPAKWRAFSGRTNCAHRTAQQNDPISRGQRKRPNFAWPPCIWTNCARNYGPSPKPPH